MQSLLLLTTIFASAAAFSASAPPLRSAAYSARPLRTFAAAPALPRASRVALADSAVICDEVQCEETELETDRLAQFKVKPAQVFFGSAVIVAAATALQIVTPGWMVATFGCKSGLGASALGTVTFLNGLKRTSPIALVLGHGILTKACADALAQTIPNQDEDEVWIDTLRVFRSMLASVLSTSLPFYWWTRFMAAGGVGVAPAAMTGLLGAGFGTALYKTVVTQATFRPLNVFMFLFLQSVFRGDSARQLADVIRTKIKASVLGGIAFYSVSNLLMYSVPVPFLHPIMGSVAGLIFNVWLAIVAYRK